MKKIFSILLLLLLLLTSCTQGIISETDEKEVETNTSSVEQTENINSGNTEDVTEQKTISSSEIFSLIPEKYENHSQFSMCIQNNIDNCMQQSAGEEGVECSDFILESNKQSCLQNKITAQALESKDSKICEQLVSSDGCEYEVVMAQARDADDVSVCKDLEGIHKVDCNNLIIQEQAREAKDSKICDKILSRDDNGNFEKDFCIQEIQFIIEEEKRNKELLEDIEQQALSPPPPANLISPNN